MLERKKKTAIIFSAAIFTLLLDRLFKFIALQNIWSYDFLPGIFKFSLAKNQYIAFSLPFGGMLLNLIVGLIIAVLIVSAAYLYKKQEFSAVYLLFFILGGSFSNYYDRLRHGFVIDYFDLSFFTIFNLADVMISTATLTLFVLSWLEGEKKQKETEAEI